MSNREFWFYGNGVDLCHLEDFCSLSQYDQLVEDVRCYELALPHPLDCFRDDNNEDAIVVMPYQIDPLGGTEQLKQISFYSKQDLSKLLFEALKPTYLSKADYCEIEELDDLSDEAFEAAFIEKISRCFSYLELCHYA